MSWQEVKAMIRKFQGEKFCKPKQIWWANIGDNIGDEINGKGDRFLRPVLIIKVFRKGLCLVVPFTTQTRKGKEFMPVSWQRKNGDFCKNTLLLHQVRTLSTKRLVNRVGGLKNQKQFEQILDGFYQQIQQK